MHELQIVEESLAKPGNVNMAQGFVKLKGKPKSNEKKKKRF